MARKPAKNSKNTKSKPPKSAKKKELENVEAEEFNFDAENEDDSSGNEKEPAQPHKRAKKGAAQSQSEASGGTRVYKYLDLVGIGEDGIEQAIQTALDRASKSVRHIDWVEVKEIRGKVTDGKLTQYQVHFRAGFKLEG